MCKAPNTPIHGLQEISSRENLFSQRGSGGNEGMWELPSDSGIGNGATVGGQDGAGKPSF